MESTETLPRDRGFHLLRVRRIIDETRDARSILFEVPCWPMRSATRQGNS